MKNLVIFGSGKIADVVFYYAKHECNYNVVAFTVDGSHLRSTTFNNLPVVPFETLAREFPKDSHDLFIAVGYQEMNALRESKFNQGQRLDYDLISIVSPHAPIPKNVTYGNNCFIMPPALIHPCVTLGNNVFVFSGAMVGHHAKIGDHCWLTSCCNISGVVTVGKNCFIAVNATIGHQVNIGNHCFIGANALVTKDLPANKVVIEENSKIFRLESCDFLKLSKFSKL